MQKTLYLMIVFFLALQLNNLFGQPVTEKKNIIAISPIGMTNKIYKLSYSRYITEHLDLSVSTRLKIQNNEFFGNFNIDDPFWYYSKYAVRAGALIHKGAMFLEPLLQYEYGFFKNEVLEYSDTGYERDDVYVTLNRKYESIGLIALVGFRQTTRFVSFKYYIGIGGHYRIYEDKVLQIESYNDPQHYNIPHDGRYDAAKITLHTGFELGFRF